MKTRYSNFYNKDSKRGTIWNPYGKKMYLEVIWKTPYWIAQEKDAKILVWIFRISFFGSSIIWLLIIFSRFGMIK